jgi:dUTP diphosphatase
MSTELPLRVKVLAHGQGLPLPAYQSAEAAGIDLLAATPEGQRVRLNPCQRALIPTGLCLELPRGFEAQIRARSGLALNHGVTVLNSPGTVDSDYRGEVKVLLINLGDKDFYLERGMRIAQLVVAPVSRVRLVVAAELIETGRGDDGFGSTDPSTDAASCET